MKLKWTCFISTPTFIYCVWMCVLKLTGRITSKAFNLLWLFCVGPQGDSSRMLHSHCPLTGWINPHTHSYCLPKYGSGSFVEELTIRPLLFHTACTFISDAITVEVTVWVLPHKQCSCSFSCEPVFAVTLLLERKKGNDTTVLMFLEKKFMLIKTAFNLYKNTTIINKLIIRL